jgi:hypothetical protein
MEPLIPPAKHGGRDREADVREVVNGIMYVLSARCQCMPLRRRGALYSEGSAAEKHLA